MTSDNLRITFSMNFSTAIFSALLFFVAALTTNLAFAGDMITISAAFQPGEVAYQASNKVYLSSPRGGTITKYDDQTPSCGVGRVIFAHSRDGKSITSEPEFLVTASAKIPNRSGPRPPLLIGAHLEQGWYKFVPLSQDSKTYCRGTVFIKMNP